MALLALKVVGIKVTAHRRVARRAQRPLLIKNLVPRITGSDPPFTELWTPQALAQRWGDVEISTRSQVAVGLGMSPWHDAMAEVKETLREYLDRAAAMATNASAGAPAHALFVDEQNHPALLAKVRASR